MGSPKNLISQKLIRVLSKEDYTLQCAFLAGGEKSGLGNNNDQPNFLSSAQLMHQ